MNALYIIKHIFSENIPTFVFVVIHFKKNAPSKTKQTMKNKTFIQDLEKPSSKDPGMNSCDALFWNSFYRQQFFFLEIMNLASQKPRLKEAQRDLLL